MTTVTELKELFIKLGGDPEKVKGLQTDAEVIDLLKTTNLGIELPTTTTEDEGKILQVDSEGNWDKADAPIGLPEAASYDNGKTVFVTGNNTYMLDKIIKKISKTGNVVYGQTNSSIIAPELNGKTILRVEPKNGSSSNSECYIFKRNNENYYQIYVGATTSSNGKVEFVVAESSAEYTFDIYYID